MSKKKLLLIDGFALAFRAFYALPPTMTLPDGTPINAVYGFTNLLLKSMETFNPDYVCVCFDHKEKGYRKEIYPEYKAHRSEPPEEFKLQVPLIFDLVEGLGIPQLSKAGYEADDLIGMFSKMASESAVETFIVSGDQDLFQLVNDHVNVVMSDRKTGDLILYTPEKVAEKIGVPPERVVDYKALRGDSSDNIPGVKGIGEKTAVSLLNDFNNLEEIYENLDSITSQSVKVKLISDKENAFISQKLAQIVTEPDIDKSIKDLTFKPDWQRIIQELEKYKFTQLVKRLQTNIESSEGIKIELTSPKEDKKGNYVLVDTEKEFLKLLSSLKGGFAIDLETTSLNAKAAQIVGIAIAYEKENAFYVPLNDYLQTSEEDVQTGLFGGAEPTKKFGGLSLPFKLNPILKSFKPILEDPSIPKVTHNGKYETVVFSNYGIDLDGISFDTMIGAFCAFPTERVSLKDLASRHLNATMTTYDEVTGTGKSRISFEDVPIESAVQYAAADADYTLRLKDIVSDKLKEDSELMKLYTTIELPLQAILAQMEASGVALDIPYLSECEKTFTHKLDALTQEIYKKAGESFNISSPKQLSEILFHKLNLPVVKRTKTGISTDSSVLEKLAPDHDIAKDLLAYRTLEKLLGTYVRALPSLINPLTGKIHTSFNQTIAATGRLSSTNPNLQNIPIRSEEGQKIRQAFIPSTPKGKILSIDYSQIELRLMAHLSEDDNMISAFLHGEDIHKATAAVIYDCALDQVTKEQRYNAKAVNFGIIYGISAFGLSQNIGVSRSEAKTIIEQYFTQFPKIKTFMNDTIAFAEENGFVRTQYGRIRPVPEIKDKMATRRQFGERMAVNTRVQGTAAEILKIAMINVHKQLKDSSLHSKMIIQVHDELVFDVVEGEEQSLAALAKSEMEKAVMLRVPLTVDVEIGPNWRELQPF